MVRCTKAKTVLPCLTLKEMGKSYNENAKGSHTFHPPSCWTNVSSSKPPNHARIRHHHCMRELPAPDYRSSWDRINFQSDVASHRVRKSIRTHQQWVKNVYEQRACFVAFASSLFCKYSLKIAVFPGYPFKIPWRRAVMSTCSFALRGIGVWVVVDVEKTRNSRKNKAAIRRCIPHKALALIVPCSMPRFRPKQGMNGVCVSGVQHLRDDQLAA